MLSQIPAAPSGAIETWLLSFAAIASIAVLAKKLFHASSRTGGEGDYVTKTDFYHEMTAFCDKIDAGTLATLQRIEHAKNQLIASAEHRTELLSARLNIIESAVARLDERTKNATPPSHPSP